MGNCCFVKCHKQNLRFSDSTLWWHCAGGQRHRILRGCPEHSEWRITLCLHSTAKLCCAHRRVWDEAGCTCWMCNAALVTLSQREAIKRWWDLLLWTRGQESYWISMWNSCEDIISLRDVWENLEKNVMSDFQMLFSLSLFLSFPLFSTVHPSIQASPRPSCPLLLSAHLSRGTALGGPSGPWRQRCWGSGGLCTEPEDHMTGSWSRWRREKTAPPKSIREREEEEREGWKHRKKKWEL